MKIVAAAKLRRAQENIIRARPYAYKLREILKRVSVKVDPDLHPLLRKKNPEKVVYVVVTSDRGLCAGFNNNIINTAENLIQEEGYKNISLICVGSRGYNYFKRIGSPILEHYISLFNNLEYSHAQQITDTIIDLYIREHFDRVLFVYNEFKSAIRQTVIAEQLLPMQTEEPDNDNVKGGQIEYLFEPEPLRILDTIIPLNVGIQIWRMLLESSAAEQGARMTAMESATKNAEEMIESLTRQYNRVRQAAITKEISEIVGGAEALQ